MNNKIKDSTSLNKFAIREIKNGNKLKGGVDIVIEDVQGG